MINVLASIHVARLRARATRLKEKAGQAPSKAIAHTFLEVARDYENDAAAIEARNATTTKPEGVGE